MKGAVFMKLRKQIAIILSVMCLSTILYIPTFAQDTKVTSQNLDLSIEKLEQKYNVRIKEAPTAKLAETYTDEELEDILQDLEMTLARGAKAREENQKEYEQYMNSVEMLNRESEPISANNALPRKIKTTYYFQNIGTVVPGGTKIRCSMTGSTTTDTYGNTVWGSFNNHSSKLYSGYGTDWEETDFSYQALDGGRTFQGSFIGTLEEPYKVSGVIKYYVYSEGWRIWFEAYARG